MTATLPVFAPPPPDPAAEPPGTASASHPGYRRVPNFVYEEFVRRAVSLIAKVAVDPKAAFGNPQAEIEDKLGRVLAFVRVPGHPGNSRRTFFVQAEAWAEVRGLPPLVRVPDDIAVALPLALGALSVASRALVPATAARPAQPARLPATAPAPKKALSPRMLALEELLDSGPRTRRHEKLLRHIIGVLEEIRVHLLPAEALAAAADTAAVEEAPAPASRYADGQPARPGWPDDDALPLTRGGVPVKTPEQLRALAVGESIVIYQQGNGAIRAAADRLGVTVRVFKLPGHRQRIVRLK